MLESETPGEPPISSYELLREFYSELKPADAEFGDAASSARVKMLEVLTGIVEACKDDEEAYQRMCATAEVAMVFALLVSGHDSVEGLVALEKAIAGVSLSGFAALDRILLGIEERSKEAAQRFVKEGAQRAIEGAKLQRAKRAANDAMGEPHGRA